MKTFYFLAIALYVSSALAQSARGQWREDVYGMTKCLTQTPYGPQELPEASCPRLRGEWRKDHYGTTYCFRAGSSSGAQTIDSSYCPEL